MRAIVPAEGPVGHPSAKLQRSARIPLVVAAATSARLGRVRQTSTDAELRVREFLRQLGIRPVEPSGACLAHRTS